MKTLAEATKDLKWLGDVIKLETIGKYQIATFKEKDFDTDEITDKLCYHGYVDGENIMNETFNSYEECLVCNIAVSRGDNGDAGRYFMKMTGNN